MFMAGSVAAVISRGDLGTKNVAGAAGPLLATTQACSNGYSSTLAAADHGIASGGNGSTAGVQGPWGDVWAALQALAAQHCYVLALDGTRLFPSSPASTSADDGGPGQDDKVGQAATCK